MSVTREMVRLTARGLLKLADLHGVPNNFAPSEVHGEARGIRTMDIGRVVKRERKELNRLLLSSGLKVTSYAKMSAGNSMMAIRVEKVFAL